MQRVLTPAQRLIVAADFKPSGFQDRHWVRGQVLALADELEGMKVCLKVNTALRAVGYGLIEEIQERGLAVFADLKLVDIGETLSTDGVLLGGAKPELLTTVCMAGVSALQALKSQLPETEVLGVTVLTSLMEDDTESMFGCSVIEAVLRFAEVAAQGNLDGVISSAHEAETLRAKFGNRLSLNALAIRPPWAIVTGDDQNPNRITTPAMAIKAGADRIVVGRPITQAEHPRDAVERTVDEIGSAME